MNVFNNVILARNRQLPDDDRMIETCRSIFKSFNVNNLSVCIGWCADQVMLKLHYLIWKILASQELLSSMEFFSEVYLGD